MADIARVTEPEEVTEVRELFAEYARAVASPECFAAFDLELAGLPGGYLDLWLVREGSTPAGCVGLRGVDPASAEIKRLYVRPAHRGRGVGRSLAEAAIQAARARGYARVVLDTLPSMQEAMKLYRRLGFRDAAPYLAQPTPNARCLELKL